ncbi:hypothetical protein NFI96_030343, partial [Prochilodus magdalenae]
RWWGFSTTVWMVLVLIVVIVVLLSVWVQVYTSKRPKRSVQVPVPAHQPKTFSKRRVKYEELFLEKTPKDYSREKIHLSYPEIFKRGLSPINEVSMTDVSLDEDGEEKMFDCTVTEEACLHHRSHPSHKDEEEST